MVLSLAVIGLMVGFIYLFLPRDDSDPELERVDYRIELVTARRAAPYPVLAPQGLPDSWKPTSVRYSAAKSHTWHLGFHIPGNDYIQVQQSTTDPAAKFLDDATQGAEETDVTERIGGRTWTRWTGGRYDALVHQDGPTTTVVAGTASFEKLARMAEALSED
jgi:hypothetical protein